MTGLRRTAVAGLTLCGALAGGTLQAANGLLIVEKSTGAGAPSTNQIQIEANRMRVETTGPTGSKQVVIFDGPRGVLIMIDNDRKTYTEVTREEADKLGAQVSDAMAQMKRQMESLPPEQRAQMEAMMKGRMGGAGMAMEAPKIVYRKTGKGEVGKWACDRYEGYAGETRTMELCTVSPQALGFTAADFAVTKQLGEFFAKLMPQMRAQMFAIGDTAEQGFAGVPVRRVVTMGGREMTSEITEITRQSFADASYAAPAGYRKEVLGPMGRGR